MFLLETQWHCGSVRKCSGDTVTHDTSVQVKMSQAMSLFSSSQPSSSRSLTPSVDFVPAAMFCSIHESHVARVTLMLRLLHRTLIFSNPFCDKRHMRRATPNTHVCVDRLEAPFFFCPQLHCQHDHPQFITSVHMCFPCHSLQPVCTPDHSPNALVLAQAS